MEDPRATNASREHESGSRYRDTAVSKEPRRPLFSFFAGAGFLDLGFESEGFDPVFVNEYNPEFLRAYRFARERIGIAPPKFGYFEGSIESLLTGAKAKHFAEQVQIAKQRGLVGFIGGPPCPDFSIGGKNRGHHGENGRLTGSYFDLICKFKPDWFLFENVKGLWKTKPHRAFYESQKTRARRAGYAVTERLINSIEYGVAQDRERVIMLGFRRRQAGRALGEVISNKTPWLESIRYDAREALTWPWPQQEDDTESSLFANRMSIPDELTVQYWFNRNNVLHHGNAGHGFKPRAGLARFQSVVEGDDSRKSFKRLHRYRYSPTACYGNNEVHIHPEEARRITVAEALAIQSLPSDFELPPDMTLSAMFKTIGNGVPFLAAKGLAATVKHYLPYCHEENLTC